MDAHPDPALPAASPARVLQLIDELSRVNIAAWSVAGRRVELWGNDLSVLSHLVAAGSMTGVELGAVSGLASSSVTELADRLERAGMITRSRLSHDRRSVLLKPTSKGRRSVDRALARTHARLAAVLQAAGAAECGRVIHLLLDVKEALIAAAGDGRGPSTPKRTRRTS